MKLTHQVMTVVLGMGMGMLGWTTPVWAANPALAVLQRNVKESVDACVDQASKAMHQEKLDGVQVIGQQVSGITKDYAIAIFCYPVKASGDLVVLSIIVAGPSADRASTPGRKFGYGMGLYKGKLLAA